MKHLQEAISPLPKPVVNPISARLLAENNQRAYEMLLRIQSQVEANTVLSITPVRNTAP